MLPVFLTLNKWDEEDYQIHIKRNKSLTILASDNLPELLSDNVYLYKMHVVNVYGLY